MVEYGGLLVLVSAIIAMLVVVGIPGKVATEVKSAVCTILDQSGCADGQRPQAGGPPQTPPSQPVTGPGQTPPPGETGGEAQTPEELQREIEAAEREAEQAEQDAAAADREAADADREGGDPAQIAKELAIEGSGLGDAQRCITEGDLAGCGWTALTFVPVLGWLGKGGKAAKAANKARKLMERFQSFKRISAAARRRAAALRDRARQARERARRATEKLTLCKTNSFVAGTLVLLADGRRIPIEDVDVGDRVLASDPLTGRSGPRRVTDLITGQGVKQLVTVAVEIAGRRTTVITATDGHPFWVRDERRWVVAGDLAPGDRLSTADGLPATVVAAREYTRVERVHNLSVADLHTYYVTAGGGSALLVHNAPPGNCRMTSSRTSPATPSKTVFNNGKLRIDVENPVPGKEGAANIHVQFMGRGADPTKYYYNPGNGTWVSENGTVLSGKVARQIPASAIEKARNFLGIGP